MSKLRIYLHDMLFYLILGLILRSLYTSKLNPNFFIPENIN